MQSETSEIISTLLKLQESVSKMDSAVKNLPSELEEIKNNLQVISEIINQLANDQKKINIYSQGKYQVFGKFVGDCLEGMAQTDAEKTVLEIVEVLHKCQKANVQC